MVEFLLPLRCLADPEKRTRVLMGLGGFGNAIALSSQQTSFRAETAVVLLADITHISVQPGGGSGLFVLLFRRP